MVPCASAHPFTGNRCGTALAHTCTTVDTSRKDSRALREILPAWPAPSGCPNLKMRPVQAAIKSCKLVPSHKPSCLTFPCRSKSNGKNHTNESSRCKKLPLASAGNTSKG